MAAKKLLPIFRRSVIRDDRKNLMVHFRFDDKATGQPQDLSSYTLAGAVALTKGAPVLAAISFDNTLPGGIIKGYLTSAASTAIVAAALAAGATDVYWDIKATTAGSEDEQWFEGSAQISQVVTA